jgi:predicted nucleotidyltransferase
MVQRSNSMIDLIEDNRQAIEDLCRQYGVRRLAVFGWAVKGTLDPTSNMLILGIASDRRPIA